MGLFDQILNAIDQPDRQASSNQLGNILGVVEQVSRGRDVNAVAMQTALSVVGRYVRSALQQQREVAGQERVQEVVQRYSGTQPNPAAVEALFTPEQQQQVTRDLSQTSGLNLTTVQALLPTLVPLVLDLLRSGAQTQQPQQGNNPVLNTFLDSDRDGDVDLGDVVNLAGDFLGRRS